MTTSDVFTVLTDATEVVEKEAAADLLQRQKLAEAQDQKAKQQKATLEERIAARKRKKEEQQRAADAAT